MKFKRIIYLCFIFVVLSVLFLIYLLNSTSNEAYTVNDFVAEHELGHAEIINLKDKSYIFNENEIYVYREKSSYEYSHGNKVNNFIVGGLEKGSLGVIVDEVMLSHAINSYSVIIDGQEGPHKRIIKKGKNMVIIDERIWNPTPNFTIIFFDQYNKVIGSLKL